MRSYEIVCSVDWISRFIWNIHTYLPDCMASYPRRHVCIFTATAMRTLSLTSFCEFFQFNTRWKNWVVGSNCGHLEKVVLYPSTSCVQSIPEHCAVNLSYTLSHARLYMIKIYLVMQMHNAWNLAILLKPITVTTSSPLSIFLRFPNFNVDKL